MATYSFIARAALLSVLSFVFSVSVLAEEAEEPSADEQPAELDEMVVTAALEPLSRRDVAASMTIITREEIEQRQVKYLADLLRDVPGFNVSQSGGTGSQTQLRVRGSEANQVLVLMDGVRANDPASGDEFQFQYALTADIERIEIVRGPQSSIWGSDAIAGVINIIRRKDAYRNTVGGHAEIGSFDTLDLALNGAAETSGGLKLRGGVSYYDTEGINIARTGDEKDGSENTTVDAGLEYAFNDAWSGLLSGQFVDATTDFDDIDYFDTGLPTDGDLVTEAERTYLRGAVRYAPQASKWSGNASVNWTDSDNRNFAYGFASSSTAAEVLDARLRASWLTPGNDPGQEHRLTAALDYIDTRFSQRGFAYPPFDPNQDQSFDQASGALEYVGRVDQDLTLTLSGRYNDFSDFDNAGTWQAALSHRVYENFRVRGSYGTGIKVPTFTERFGFYPGLFVGNPDLKPETSRGWEIGADWVLAEGRVTLGGAYFDQDLQDEIDGFVIDPESGLYTAVNKDSDSERKGFELVLDSEPLPGFSLGASYTYTDASEINAADKSVSEVRRPRHMGSISANYRYAEDRANLNLNVNYTGEQTDVFFDPVTYLPETVNLDSYTVLDLAGSWQITQSLELVGRITNLTDEDYEEVLGYSRPGRGFYGGLRGRFGF
jgi:vitamin B12 transporter